MQDRDLLLACFSQAAQASTSSLDARIDAWAHQPDAPLLIVGSPASNRSESLCRFAARRRDLGDAVVLHHAGLTAPAAETPRVLWRLLMQLRTVADIVQMPPADETGMRETLPNWLARAAAAGPLWLVIADLDALAGLDGGIAWWPDHQPPNLYCLASVEPGACMQRMASAGWERFYLDDAAPAAIMGTPKTSWGAGAAEVAATLALAREPFSADRIADVTGLEVNAVRADQGALQDQILITEDGRWAPAHPVIRKAWLRGLLANEGPRQRRYEALAAHADALSAPAYFRAGKRPDLALDALMCSDAIRAAESPAGRMSWLAEWTALGAGEAAPILSQLLAQTPITPPERAAKLHLCAYALMQTAGERAPVAWLDRAVTLSDSADQPALAARARRYRAQAAIDDGDWSAAEHDAQAALASAGTSDERGAASARHELARAAEAAGNTQKARLLYEQALAAAESVHGADSPHLLPGLANLIGVLRAAHQLEAASTLARRAAHIARVGCGAGHPATAAACDQLASLAYAGSDYGAAEAAYREALAASETAFGPEHVATAAALHNLGTVLDARRSFSKAEDCFRQALAVRERVHGREHSDTAATLHNLAAVLEVVGRAEEAEKLYRETVDIWERLYGAEHAATVTSLTNLAGVLAARDAYADAEACYRAAVEGWRRLLGDQHPNTLSTLAELAALYAHGDKPELAEPLLAHVVETSRDVLGVTDAHHVNSVCTLSALWRDQGRHDDARALLTETLAGVESGLGLLAPAVQQLRRQLDTLRGEALH